MDNSVLNKECFCSTYAIMKWIPMYKEFNMANKKTKPTAYLEIGKRLRSIRKELGVTSVEMAKRLGLAKNSYNKNEYGITNPGISTLYQLSETYNISMDWMLFGRGEMYRLEEVRETPGRVGDSVAEENNGDNGSKNEVMSLAELLLKLVGHDEVGEFLKMMTRVPLLRHELLLHYHKFKRDYKDIEEDSSKTDPIA